MKLLSRWPENPDELFSKFKSQLSNITLQQASQYESMGKSAFKKKNYSQGFQYQLTAAIAFQGLNQPASSARVYARAGECARFAGFLIHSIRCYIRAAFLHHTLTKENTEAINNPNKKSRIPNLFHKVSEHERELDSISNAILNTAKVYCHPAYNSENITRMKHDSQMHIHPRLRKNNPGIEKIPDEILDAIINGNH